MNKKYLVALTGGLASLWQASGAHSAGFEKSVMWSGRHAGYGSAAVSVVSGSQALYFNPAGLAGPGDVSLNFSPTWLKLEGSLASAGTKEETDQGALPVGGALVSYSFGRFGFGMGFYAVGGEKAHYSSVDLSGDSGRTNSITPDLFTDLQLTEYAFGAGFEAAPGLRFGAAWRITKAVGSLATIKKAVTNSAYSLLSIKDARDTSYGGFRLGAQYEPEGRGWGVGASFRSKGKFDAPGTGEGLTQVIASGTLVAQTVRDTRVGLVFPSALAFGGHYAVSRTVKLLAGVDFVKYSDNDNIYIVGTSDGVTLPNIPLNWSDMWSYRLGVEYTGLRSVALRAGYVLASQVTSSVDAKATLPPPGKGHLVTLGAGYALSDSLDLDGAFEYGFNRGDGSMTMPTSTTKELLAGVTTETKARSVALHTGVTYRF